MRADYVKCLCRLRNSKKQTIDKAFYDLFGRITGKENLEVSLILENVMGSSDSVGLLDVQDTCFYIGELLSKYLLPDSLTTKINQLLAVNEAVYSQERAEWLKEALIPDHSISTQFTSNFDLEP